PKRWNNGTVTAEFRWSHGSGNGAQVVWAIQAVGTHNDVGRGSFGTAVTVTDTGGTNNRQYVTDVTSAITIAINTNDGAMV
ncbi:hypothetical protein LMP63_13900, partial [Staphylococcus aureus]|uniref:hypothetical protein n=1 Tax=Staphylococcus aureus TaxID=1280 RepID=UPI001E28D0A2